VIGDSLECRGVVKRFGGVTALAGADLQVGGGDTLALLGASGCGKTTLLRVIAGFEIPDGGVVTLGGRVLNAPGVFVRPNKRRVGLVFQDFALFPHLNVASNIAFGMKTRGARRKRIEELLELVGLARLGVRMPHELSGGQQQRVALARSLAAEPDVILLDEPFSNLDPGMRQRVRAEVRAIIESLGTTAIFVTHDQEEALSLAERVAVMLDGRIVQVGRPSDVYRQPATRAVAEFLGDANFLTGTVRDGTLDWPLGRTSIAAARGGGVDVMVRPEDLRLSSNGDGPQVEVVARDYYGHDQMITVRLADGALVRVREQSAHEVAPGDRFGLQLAGDVVLFPRAARA
jgi:iron(III) transport system ATP-binding protein